MQELETKRKFIVDFFLKKGLLLNQDILTRLENENFFSEFLSLIENIDSQEITVLGEKIEELLKSNQQNLNWTEFDKVKVIAEKQGKKYEELVKVASIPVPQSDTKKEDFKVKVVFSYNRAAKKREAQDFIDHFNLRFKAISSILKKRQELQNVISLGRLSGKRDREQISVIGMVTEKRITKNGNCMLTIEDDTGLVKVIINKTKPDLFRMSKDIVLDEVIGVIGVNGDNIIFSNNIIFPDIPFTQEIKKANDEAYALFLSDLHVGSNNFLEQDFQKFLRWINQETGSDEQKNIASKVKYIFVLGDLVDGCGIYPGQEKELKIKDIKDQYKECTRLLDKIPKNIKLVVCPGNHDAMRVAEPQLPIYKDFSSSLYELKNITMVSNPSVVNIHSSDDFSGFDVLIYHGYSFDYYVAEVESIRNNGGYDRADLIMKFLLQKRHLAPCHTSTLYVPDAEVDSLLINKAPDFFVSGHIHKSAAANYKNVTLISGSCWQSKTAFQEKVGHNPEPSRVPLVNLKTRQIKMLKFGK